MAMHSKAPQAVAVDSQAWREARASVDQFESHSEAGMACSAATGRARQGSGASLARYLLWSGLRFIPMSPLQGEFSWLAGRRRNGVGWRHPSSRFAFVVRALGISSAARASR